MFHPPVIPRTPEGPRESPRADVRSLELELERVLMITEALWDILKEQHGYTDDELIRRIAMIDLKDGALDGRVAKTAPAQCPKCNRALGKRHVTCLYCGTQMVQDPFAR